MSQPRPFGDYRVRMDPWDAAYGGELQLDLGQEESAEEVDVGVEVPESAWAPISTALPPAVPRLRFVDGVRRAEARLVVSRGHTFCHGALGSCAAGVVAIDGGQAVVAREEYRRVIATGSGEVLPAPVSLGQALVYEPMSTADVESDGPLLVIHEQMRALEADLARAAAAETGTLVICDGPLTFGGLSPGQAVGFVKRLFRLYLPEPLMRVLATLRVGQRSPVFLIGGRFRRLSWYVRLGDPLPSESDLTGLARLEMADTAGLDAARATADLTAALLPRFVPPRSRDPRAPQNLLPIGALESRLRHRLGDIALIRRRFVSAVSGDVRHA